MLRPAIETLHLDHAYVVHAGEVTFPLADGDQRALGFGQSQRLLDHGFHVQRHS